MKLLHQALFFYMFLASFIFPDFAVAQERCGTQSYNAPKNSAEYEERKQRFEQWMANKTRQKISPFRTLGEVYEIPVVVHVIHNGESIGQGANIPFEQIEDQIRILNEDFRRLNEDTFNTPDIFKLVAADMEIEFVLAKQDPNGLPSDGVQRVTGTKSGWTMSDGAQMKSLSYWPAQDYFNIWVANLENDLIGYAEFPRSDLPGLEGTPNRPLQDGIVVDYLQFGSIGNVTSGSQGRTTTHEVGHFLGLLHIWGDGDCGEDDFCFDTPEAEASTRGCPFDKISCGSLDMIQNYMDYTADRCMNLFTLDQRNRMRTVLENSPRRQSLLTSPGLITPIVADNDMGIRRITSPQTSECSSIITPSIELTNFGEKEVNSYKVKLYLQGNFVEEAGSSEQLATGESTNLTFSTLTLGSPGRIYELSFEISQVNGGTDENDKNDLQTVNFDVPELGSLPLFDDLENPSESQLIMEGAIDNPDDSISWQLTEAPGNGNDNHALFLNFFEYEFGVGERDILYTPNYNFSDIVEATLVFKVAHAQYIENNESNDRLTIAISTDCGNQYSSVVYNKAGKALATAAPINSAFVPASRTDWREEEISLNPYAGQPNVRIAFIGQNDYGNNLYIDDVEIRVVVQTNNDISIRRIISPASLSCNTTPVPQVLVKNTGKNVISNFIINFSVDGAPEVNILYDNPPLQPEEERIIQFNAIDLPVGNHTLDVRLSQPNAAMDQQPDNNFQSLSFTVDDNQDIIPIVNRFQGPAITDLSPTKLSDSGQAWRVVNPDGDVTWQLAETQGNGAGNLSAQLPHYNYTKTGQTDMLVSPTLDFSQTREASMFFKVSYAYYNAEYVDTLRVLISTDCGATYQPIYEKFGEELSVTETTEEWFPITEADWRREFIDLTAFAGLENVRLAFAAVNGFGNNLFLDDIELFVSDDPDPIIPEEKLVVYPNPAGADGLVHLTFNLLEKEEVNVQIFTMQGKMMGSYIFPNTLNQTYTLDFSQQPAGIYAMRILSPSLNPVKRVIVP